MAQVASERCGRVEEVLLCGAAPYDADSHRATVEVAVKLGPALALPEEWSLVPALRRPLRSDELATVVPKLLALKKRDRWPDETYPERQATLALWTLRFEGWPPNTRCGVAWATTVLGMWHHHFRLRPGHERILLPSQHFFLDYSTVDSLAGLLRLAYVDTRSDLPQAVA